jgi:uncharacterized protein (TIGR02270 family)
MTAAVERLMAAGEHRAAMFAAANAGFPAPFDTMFDISRDPTVSRAFGEAFSTLTGLDLVMADMEDDPPKGFTSGPNDNPNDEAVEMDPDENLPWPNIERVEHWWKAHRTRFSDDVRYVCGKPVTADHLQEVLRTGKQRQRAAAALELAILQPGQPLFEVRAPGFRQQQLLGLRRTPG